VTGGAAAEQGERAGVVQEPVESHGSSSIDR